MQQKAKENAENANFWGEMRGTSNSLQCLKKGFKNVCPGSQDMSKHTHIPAPSVYTVWRSHLGTGCISEL